MYFKHVGDVIIYLAVSGCSAQDSVTLASAKWTGIRAEQQTH